MPGENFWGQFGTAHLLTIAAAMFFIVIVYLYLRKETKRNQIITLFALSIIGLASIVYEFITTASLPLDWWALSAILLPLAVLLRGKHTCNILLLWSLSSLIRILCNPNITGLEWINASNVLHYITDVFVFGITVLLFELNLVKRDLKTIKVSFFASSVIYLAVVIINIVYETNYMSSAIPTNDFLKFLYSFFYVPHWYMILAIPFLLFYMFWWYLPEILEERKKNAPLRRRLKAINKYYREYKKEYIDEIIEEKYD